MEDGAERVGAFSHGYTYSGHPIGAATANAVLDIVERENLVEKAASTGAYLQACMHERFAHLPRMQLGEHCRRHHPEHAHRVIR